ncbi:MAG TPA: cytochrome c biogenesis protein CcsA [Stellaceae bacterium]|nr:cytochrome c biogenesis protein CcsA [Stellaceae bacterium]
MRLPRRRVAANLRPMGNMVLGFGALLALVPAASLSFRRGAGRDALFLALLVLGLAGPGICIVASAGGEWRTGFAMSLWVTIAATMALFLALSLATRHAWQLAPLLLPYLMLLAAIALVWQGAPERPVVGDVPAGWLDAHILFAVATYGLLTIGAVAGFAVFLQERALKAKRPNALTRRLPPMAESEMLELRLLAAAEAVLALGLMSGMAAEHFLGGRLLPFDHKTLFSLAAFFVIGVLLLARYRQGIRGRRVARLALLAWLLLTLAYPGVKFVTDVLLG